MQKWILLKPYQNDQNSSSFFFVNSFAFIMQHPCRFRKVKSRRWRYGPGVNGGCNERLFEMGEAKKVIACYQKNDIMDKTQYKWRARC